MQNIESLNLHLRDLAVAARGPALSRAAGRQWSHLPCQRPGAGLTFGEYVMSVLWRQLRLVENRFFAPLFAAPFATRHRKNGRGKEENESSD